MVIFHCYVSLPEGTHQAQKKHSKFIRWIPVERRVYSCCWKPSIKRGTRERFWSVRIRRPRSFGRRRSRSMWGAQGPWMMELWMMMCCGYGWNGLNGYETWLAGKAPKMKVWFLKIMCKWFGRRHRWSLLSWMDSIGLGKWWHCSGACGVAKPLFWPSESLAPCRFLLWARVVPPKPPQEIDGNFKSFRVI